MTDKELGLIIRRQWMTTYGLSAEEIETNQDYESTLAQEVMEYNATINLKTNQFGAVPRVLLLDPESVDALKAVMLRAGGGGILVQSALQEKCQELYKCLSKLGLEFEQYT